LVQILSSRRALATVVTSLIILVASVSLSGVVTYFAIDTTSLLFQQQSLQISMLHVWCPRSPSSFPTGQYPVEAAFCIINTGGRDVVINKITIHGQAVPWTQVYSGVGYVQSDLAYVPGKDESPNNAEAILLTAHTVGTLTMMAVVSEITLSSGQSMVVYVMSPGGVSVSDLGLTVGVALFTSQSLYYSEANVEGYFPVHSPDANDINVNGHKQNSVPTPQRSSTPTITPTSIPTTTPSSTNLEPLSAFYADMNGAASSYASLDNSVLHNGNPSIKVGPDYVRWTREVDGAWIRIRPGDHIVMSVWVKTDSCPSSTDPQGGACFGWDFETTASSAAFGSLAIVDISSNGTQAGHPTGLERGWGVGTYGYSFNGAAGLSQVNGNVVRVPWGTDWTLIQWDFIVPSTYYNYVTTDASFPNAMPSLPVQIDTMVPWFEGRNLYDTAYAYFSEPELFINP
jgi:hypothetical protein